MYIRTILSTNVLLLCRFVYGESNVDGELNDEGFTFEFGYLRNKIQSANEGCFLCTNDQLESYLRGLADIIEREMGLFTPDEIEVKLNQLEKLAPDFLKVHYSRYLNCLSNADYPAAMDSLHRYFDYSAGKGALNGGGSGGASTGRFQAGLLALGSMHARFGHITQALHSLNEAVGIAQQNNDDACLAHALAALCHLISEVGALTDSSISDADGSKLDARNGPSMSIEEQLLLLLNCCLRRAVET
ncbi:hypothetical protein KP509_1Z323000 [Ceratopteris richardii]|nr:hypothetical protein KP509_1Z323000 [Ceratopteris richardii]